MPKVIKPEQSIYECLLGSVSFLLLLRRHKFAASTILPSEFRNLQEEEMMGE